MQVADQRYQVDEFSVPKIGPDEGLLKIEACGMCGSDVEQYDGAFAALGVTYPVIAGHEPIGTIEDIGAAAAQRWNVRVGDRVAIEPVLSCGHCRPCLTGRYRRCATGRPGAGQVNCYGYLPTSVRPSLWGGYAEYMYLDPQTVLHKLDPALPIELAALYQPMAAGVRWFAHESNLALGDTVVILGCGQRGLAGLVAAREAGAGRVIVTGLESDAHNSTSHAGSELTPPSSPTVKTPSSAYARSPMVGWPMWSSTYPPSPSSQSSMPSTLPPGVARSFWAA